MRAAGGCDFAKSALDAANPVILWTMTALPTVVPLTSSPTNFDTSSSRPLKFQRDWITARDGAELRLVCKETAFRVHELANLDAQSVCAVLPIDALFDVRLKAVRRLWLAAGGRNVGPDPATLPKTQRGRLVGALRALDGRLEGATHREIAIALFGARRIPERGWKTHDLRDRTIRLARLGNDLMQGGYRRLLLYPFRQRPF